MKLKTYLRNKRAAYLRNPAMGPRRGAPMPPVRPNYSDEYTPQLWSLISRLHIPLTKQNSILKLSKKIMDGYPGFGTYDPSTSKPEDAVRGAVKYLEDRYAGIPFIRSETLFR